MAGVTSASSAPKSHAGSSGSSSPSSSSSQSSSNDKSKNKPSNDKKTTNGGQTQSSNGPSSASNQSDQKKTQPNQKDSFEGKDDKKKLVDLHGETRTDALHEQKDQAHVAPGTDASSHTVVGQGEAHGNATVSANENGVDVNADGGASVTALKNESEIKNTTQLTGGDHPITADSKLQSTVDVGAEVHANGNLHVDKDGNASGGFDVGGFAGAKEKVSLSTDVSTVGEDGKKEELGGATLNLNGVQGIGADAKGGFEFKDGTFSTHFGVDAGAIVGGGFDVNLRVNPENIAKEIARDAGQLGDQVQKGIGETLSGIQKFLGGVHLFG
jgi:hypothetical protein